jgi:hypothetical protein
MTANGFSHTVHRFLSSERQHFISFVPPLINIKRGFLEKSRNDGDILWSLFDLDITLIQ